MFIFMYTNHGSITIFISVGFPILPVLHEDPVVRRQARCVRQGCRRPQWAPQGHGSRRLPERCHSRARPHHRLWRVLIYLLLLLTFAGCLFSPCGGCISAMLVRWNGVTWCGGLVAIYILYSQVLCFFIQ